MLVARLCIKNVRVFIGSCNVGILVRSIFPVDSIWTPLSCVRGGAAHHHCKITFEVNCYSMSVFKLLYKVRECSRQCLLVTVVVTEHNVKSILLIKKIVSNNLEKHRVQKSQERARGAQI